MTIPAMIVALCWATGTLLAVELNKDSIRDVGFLEGVCLNLAIGVMVVLCFQIASANWPSLSSLSW